MTFAKRFALRTLLMSMLVVAYAFGYLQRRRQRIIADVEWLNAVNGRMIVGRGLWVENMQTLHALAVHDGIMPTVSVVADPLSQDSLFSRIQSWAACHYVLPEVQMALTGLEETARSMRRSN